eukprot:347315_1
MYNTANYSILRQFVNEHDVPINIQDDNGDTVIHHMIRNADYSAIYALLGSLKPQQRFNFHIKNDKEYTIIHELMKQKNWVELIYLLNMAKTKAFDIPIDVTDDFGNTIIHLMIRDAAYGKIYQFFKGFKTKTDN